MLIFIESRWSRYAWRVISWKHITTNQQAMPKNKVMVFEGIKISVQTNMLSGSRFYFLLRSIPAFLATASSPFFSMVFMAFVDNLSFTNRLPSSHQILLYWRFTNCNFFVLWFEWETLFALLDFLPVKGHTLPEKTECILLIFYTLLVIKRRQDNWAQPTKMQESRGGKERSWWCKAKDASLGIFDYSCP